jgi:hypothetical protein
MRRTATPQAEHGGVFGIDIGRDDAAIPRVPRVRGSHHREEHRESERAPKEMTESGIPKHGSAFSNRRTTR